MHGHHHDGMLKGKHVLLVLLVEHGLEDDGLLEDGVWEEGMIDGGRDHR